jgi:hypothetical protein
VDRDVDPGVDHAAQVELPMDQEERRIAPAVPGVHHHLRDVDRPALVVDAAAEDRPDPGRHAVRVDALEVVAGHGLVDRDEPEHPVVALPELRLGRLRRGVVRDRGDEVHRLLARLERPRRVQHRLAEPAQEERRPLDHERLVGERDDVVLADECLDPAELGDAEVEQLVPARVLDRDPVEDGPDERVVSHLDRRTAQPVRGDLAGDADHLRPHRGGFTFRVADDPARRQLRIAQRVGHLRREELRTQPALALGRRKDARPEMLLERIEGGGGDLARRAEPGQDGRGVGVAVVRRGLAGREGLVHDRDQARPLLERLPGVESGDRPLPVAPQVLARRGEDRGDALGTRGERLQPDRERCEVAGQQAEQAFADQVDPPHRAPGLLAEGRVGELLGRELAEEQVAVDPVLGTQRRVGEDRKGRRPLRDEGEAVLATGRREVGPAVVVSVLADPRREDRVDREEGVEEGVDARRELGHGSLSR